MALVYILKNKTNGRSYVGKTERSLQERMREHVNCSFYGSQSHIHRAIRLYGFDSFEQVILEEFAKEHVNAREEYWIAVLGTFADGYNMTKGGDGVLGLKHTIESNEKNRLAHIGTVQSRETRLKKRSSMKSSLKVRRVSVEMIDEFGNVIHIYDSVSSAGVAMGNVDYATLISRCCRGKTKTALGKMWRYSNGDVQSTVVRQVSGKQQVVQLTFSNEPLMVHNSINAAAKSVKGTKPSIAACCHGQRHAAYGFKWKFKNSYHH